MAKRRRPGEVRDAILAFLQTERRAATTDEIRAAVEEKLGPVPQSSIRSYLGLNSPDTFRRVGRGMYELRRGGK